MVDRVVIDLARLPVREQGEVDLVSQGLRGPHEHVGGCAIGPLELTGIEPGLGILVPEGNGDPVRAGLGVGEERREQSGRRGDRGRVLRRRGLLLAGRRQVVDQADPVARRDRLDLVFAIGIEGGVLRLEFASLLGEIDGYGLSVVPHDEPAPCVARRQADRERAEHARRLFGVAVGAKKLPFS